MDRGGGEGEKVGGGRQSRGVKEQKEKETSR